jgi:hypothetical protein
MDDKSKSDIVDAAIDLGTPNPTSLHPIAMYGGTVFLTAPDKQGNFIAGALVFADHVTVELSNGANFNDRSGMLGGKGKERLHIKRHSVADIADKTSQAF